MQYHVVSFELSRSAVPILDRYDAILTVVLGQERDKMKIS